jgi:hypothetical protein
MGSMRFSILSLMGAVAVVALGLAALKSSSPAVAGATIMVTCGVLLLAVVGAACCGPSQRAWWLGFALFGWLYLPAAFFPEWFGAEPPTIEVLTQAASWAGAGPARDPRSKFAPTVDVNYAAIGHCIWALGLALLGGGLARLFFGSRPAEPGPPAAAPQSGGGPRRQWWCQPGSALMLLAASVVAAALLLLGSTSDLSIWTGAAVLLTLASLGVAVLAATFSRGRPQARWLGAGLFGLGYLALAVWERPDLEVWPYFVTEKLLAVADPLLRSVIKGYADSSDSVAAANARVHRALETPVKMPFADDMPLEEVLKHIQEATRGPDGKRLAVYIDPISRGEPDISRAQVRAIDLENVALKHSLRRCLEQNDLTYYVRDGCLYICREDAGPPVQADPFLLVGHCLLAWIAAGFGGLAGGWIWRGSGEGDVVPTA